MAHIGTGYGTNSNYDIWLPMYYVPSKEAAL